MLAEIKIKNLALIDELSLSLEPGLNVITGETGAGKSLIVQSIGLLAGGRSDASRLRTSGEAAEIEGLFQLSGGRETVIRRVLSRDGKSRSFINGRIAALSQVADAAEPLVDVHGQHDNHSLLKAGNHLNILDEFGGVETGEAKQAYRTALAAYRANQEELAELEDASRDQAARREVLAWQAKELALARLVPGEDSELEDRISRFKNRARLVESVEAAARAIGEQAVDGVQRACLEIQRVVSIDSSLQEAADKLESAGAYIEEAGAFLRDYSESLDFDSQRLAADQERLFFLADLKKKYDLSLDELIARRDHVAAELDALAGDGSRLVELRREAETLASRLKGLADKLTDARRSAADRLSRLIQGELRHLAMPRSRFGAVVRPAGNPASTFGDRGGDEVEFVFSANAGEPPRPLSKCASGGELARVMLALRTGLGPADQDTALVFDEIDAGIGGRTAVSIGQRLAALALTNQVICITHLPQIAAFGDHHLLVEKTDAGARTSIAAKPLSAEERLGELARLSGVLDPSSASREHARQLLDQARRKRRPAAAGV
jgi:DNA repair protein RecN (Recombination protein N)